MSHVHLLMVMCQEFGANSDSETARYHYLAEPFVARYVRFHPTHWKRRIGMRAGLVGCPQTGLSLPMYNVIKQQAQLMLTNPRDAFMGQSRSPNIVRSLYTYKSNI